MFCPCLLGVVLFLCVQSLCFYCCPGLCPTFTVIDAPYITIIVLNWFIDFKVANITPGQGTTYEN